MRTKRGLVDTSRHGGYCKDQVSFVGMMQLLQNRSSISFQLLHSCKLPWQRVAASPHIQRACDFGSPMLIPEFILDGETAYQLRLQQLVEVRSHPLPHCSLSRAVQCHIFAQANDLGRFLLPPT